MSLLFDPNNDRVARLTRNELSSAFMQDMQVGSLTHVQAYVDALQSLETVYKDYVEQRLGAYQRVLQVIMRDKLTDPLVQVLVLWDEELFFEIHELIEALWLVAVGDEKKAYQALIRGAGAFVHLALGNETGARKMAQKACDGLHSFGNELRSISATLPAICSALENLEVQSKLYGLIHHE